MTTSFRFVFPPQIAFGIAVVRKIIRSSPYIYIYYYGYVRVQAHTHGCIYTLLRCRADPHSLRRSFRRTGRTQGWIWSERHGERRGGARLLCGRHAFDDGALCGRSDNAYADEGPVENKRVVNTCFHLFAPSRKRRPRRVVLKRLLTDGGPPDAANTFPTSSPLAAATADTAPRRAPFETRARRRR